MARSTSGFGGPMNADDLRVLGFLLQVPDDRLGLLHHFEAEEDHVRSVRPQCTHQIRDRRVIGKHPEDGRLTNAASASSSCRDNSGSGQIMMLRRTSLTLLPVSFTNLWSLSSWSNHSTRCILGADRT